MPAALAEVFTPTSASGLPSCPDESIWPYLDAAARCVARYGWSRTSVKDVATEAGVERTTVYRRVGSMDEVFRLLIAREVHRLVSALPDSVPEGADGPEIAIELLAVAIEQSREHPVISKVLQDEPEIAAAFVTHGLGGLVQRIADALAPMLSGAMDQGLLARREPQHLAEWIARIGLSLLVLPPAGDLRVFLREMLDPVLRPSPEPSGVSR